MRCRATKQAAAANMKSFLCCGRMPTRIFPFFEKPGAHTPNCCSEVGDRKLANLQIVELKFELARRLATRKEQRPQIAAVSVEVGKRVRVLLPFGADDEHLHGGHL